MEFKVGDKVDWLGLKGKIISIKQMGFSNYPVIVDFGVVKESFTVDGRWIEEQQPSLKLIERPKKKVKKEIQVWVNVYGGEGYLGKVYLSNEEADEMNRARIALATGTLTYEVDEE